MDSAWPAADVESCLRRAQNGAVHSSLDCVWGFTQIGISPELSTLLALDTRRGLLLPKVLYFGPKQGPGTLQGSVDSSFGHLRDDDGDVFASALVDDCNISTPGYGDESLDDVTERHLQPLEIFFTAAAKR